MDEKLQAILDRVAGAELAAVAAGALGTASASLVGPVELFELTANHFDRRTIGIVRASGMAGSGDGVPRPWSAVAKITDFALAPHEENFTHPESESRVYESRTFADDGLRFRPAHCYAISNHEPSVRVLWLEDLTRAKGTPFEVRTLKTMVRHLGEWNGHHATHRTVLDIPVGRDACARRWSATNFSGPLGELATHAATPSWRQAFGGLPLTIVQELHDLLRQLVAAIAPLQRSLAFGDVAAGNVFLKGDETVAIDWASLNMDRIGVDGGCLAGGPLTWAGGATIASAEPELFEAYLDGLKDGGWTGEGEDVRRAFLCHYGIYMIYCGLMPSFAGNIGKPFSRAFLEERWKTPLENVPDEVAGTIQRFPATIAEVRRLLG